MISDRQFCREQFARFSGLRGYPETDEAKRETVNAMQRAFDHEADLERAVDDLMRTEHFCPAPATFYEAGMELRRQVKEYRPRDGERGQELTLVAADVEKRIFGGYDDGARARCPLCDDTGFERVVRNGVSAAKRCECRKAITNG